MSGKLFRVYRVALINNVTSYHVFTTWTCQLKGACKSCNVKSILTYKTYYIIVRQAMP